MSDARLTEVKPSALDRLYFNERETECHPDMQDEVTSSHSGYGNNGPSLTNGSPNSTLLDHVKKIISEHDPGALFEPCNIESIAKIREASEADWQRLRALAKDKGVKVTDLDRALDRSIEKAKIKPETSLFEYVEPWPSPVNGADLLDELVCTLRKYVICEPAVADAAVLWIVFTWFIDEVQVAPIANITAPLPNCGKSTLLGFMQTFTFKPLKCDGITPAALFRSMDKWQPTLLIDEVDTFLKDNEHARGILNSGHKRNGVIIRVVGDDHEPTPFQTWGAKALCGIGSIANTLASRSIRLELRRKLPHEYAENIRNIDQNLKIRLQRQLSRLQKDLRSTVAKTRPEPVPGLQNRSQDNWEPLLQIAESVGGKWPEHARRVAQALTKIDEADSAPEVATELLRDIDRIFKDKKTDKIFSKELLTSLLANPEASWASWNHGNGITERQISQTLAPFGAKPEQVRIGDVSKKGYKLKSFKDAFNRYL